MATSPHNSLRVLFVDDERSLQELMRSELPRLGHVVTVCPDGKTAMKVLEKEPFDAAILDVRMPGVTGIEVLQHLKKVAPDTEAIIMTGHASTETAIEALRLGAFNYITKPAKLTEIDANLQKIAEKRLLKNKNIALETRVVAAEGPTVLVGKSPAMLAVQRLISTVAPTDSTVLVLGETGTGKELVARTLWQESKRADMPFVPVNCAALAEQLVESELFGHVKGAFTGAERDHKGLFEVANGGTLFLDEMGELKQNIQVKLLRFLESGEIRRVGDTKPFRVDVRVLCATNRDVRRLVHEEQFREDLFFRVNTFEIRLPGLRERRSDIPDLARHLLARAARRSVDQVVDLISPEAVDVLLDHEWPGNVRELANAMEYAWIMAGGNQIQAEHLPHNIRNHVSALATGPAPAPRLNIAPNTRRTAELPEPAPLATHHAPLTPPSAGRTLSEMEMDHILRVVEKHNGNKPAAAAELGISLKTLYNKLNKFSEEQRRAAG